MRHISPKHSLAWSVPWHRLLLHTGARILGSISLSASAYCAALRKICEKSSAMPTVAHCIHCGKTPTHIVLTKVAGPISERFPQVGPADAFRRHHRSGRKHCQPESGDARALCDLPCYRCGRKRPSMVTRPAPISAMPPSSKSSSLSPRKTAPSKMALTGTTRVTREALVAPADAMMRK